eukprot:1986157-Rhodomonas_salina.2
MGFIPRSQLPPSRVVKKRRAARVSISSVPFVAFVCPPPPHGDPDSLNAHRHQPKASTGAGNMIS